MSKPFEMNGAAVDFDIPVRKLRFPESRAGLDRVDILPIHLERGRPRPLTFYLKVFGSWWSVLTCDSAVIRADLAATSISFA